jgi:signal transduction histidine kinase
MSTGDADEAAARAAAEAALRESEYRYRNLFQAMAASFWELDFSGVGALLRQLKAQGVRDHAAHFASHPEFVREMMRATRVLDVNDQALALFGRGDKAEMLQTVEPFWSEASNAVYAASVIAAISGKPNFTAECRLRTIEGREFDAHFTACFPQESVMAGKLLIGVIDISARVEAQEMLQRVQAEFAHAARVSILGELTASIAHEINQPLAAISTNAAAGLRWLDRPEPDLAEVRAITNRIIADARRAADIIVRVRAMATHRAPERTVLPINDAIRDAMAFLRHELQAQGATLTLDLAADLPLVRGDRIQLQQVIVNLAVNALQAMAGAASRRLNIRTSQAGGDVRIDVEDNGPGISDSNLPRLFESFFTTKDGGMGMGLPICRSIIEAHGGRISTANRDAGGACFSVTLPAAPRH